jgi:GPH family glycoside/pentoside/hexuronide:cation symporter
LRAISAGLFGSKPWIVLVGVLLLTLAAFAVKGSVSAYYFKYFVKREDLFGGSCYPTAWRLSSQCSITSHLARWIGKKPSLHAGAGVRRPGDRLLLAFAKPTDIKFIFALQIASSFIIAFNSPLVWAMFADTADHAEWRTGRRNTGLVFASAIFATKIGFAVGAWMLGLILTYFGYVANVEQTGQLADSRHHPFHELDSLRAAGAGRRCNGGLSAG